VRPGSGTSGQQADAAPGLPATARSEGQGQSGKAAFLQEQYGRAAEIGTAGLETSAMQGSSGGKAGAGAKQQAGHLTVVDDSA